MDRVQKWCFVFGLLSGMSMLAGRANRSHQSALANIRGQLEALTDALTEEESRAVLEIQRVLDDAWEQGARDIIERN